MKKLFLNLTQSAVIGIILLLSSMSAQAQGNVIFMMPSLPMYGTITVNGEQPFELKGDVKKVHKAGSVMKYDMIEYTDCYRKCIIKGEGNVLFSYEGSFRNSVSGDIYKYASEIQIDIEDGKTYYVLVERHGFNDQKLSIIPEKKAQKFMKKKNCVELPDVVIESL